MKGFPNEAEEPRCKACQVPTPILFETPGEPYDEDCMKIWLHCASLCLKLDKGCFGLLLVSSLLTGLLMTG